LRMFPRSYGVPLLFHIEHDPSELHDVAHRYPEVVAELVAEAVRLQREVAYAGPIASVEIRTTTVANTGAIVQLGRESGSNNSQPGQPIVTAK
jgi:hypothetical protein